MESAVYDRMKWLPPDEIEAAESARKSLVDRITSHFASMWAYSQTKLFTHAISPGCSLCGQGQWSCLFINGICNARCFYCPTVQDDPGQPTANTIVFEDPTDYATYVSRFHIKGVGFSGGEPLLTFERLLSYLRAIKDRTADSVYTWMYTNGLLVTKDRLEALKEAGLDEIRFDLSANEYRLEALSKAIGVIGRVTVEIPAIPEDIDTVKQLMADLERLGVNFLNLHQIRCTPYNVNRLIERGYTFIHGPHATVLESELTALSLVQHALERSINLPVNYCAFTFRHQFQGAGARRRSANEIKEGYEDITPTGHLRHMQIVGPEAVIADICQTLVSNYADPSRYRVSGKGDSLSFTAELWPLIDFSRVRLRVGYRLAVLKSALSYHHPFKKIALNGKKTVFVEKQTAVPPFWLEGEQIEMFGRWMQRPEEGAPAGLKDTLPAAHYDRIVGFETISQGLAGYY